MTWPVKHSIVCLGITCSPYKHSAICFDSTRRFCKLSAACLCIAFPSLPTECVSCFVWKVRWSAFAAEELFKHLWRVFRNIFKWLKGILPQRETFPTNMNFSSSSTLTSSMSRDTGIPVLLPNTCDMINYSSKEKALQNFSWDLWMAFIHRS